MLRLYHAPHSCALAAHICPEESGLAYEAAAVDLAAGEQGAPAYLAVNPNGRVPAQAERTAVRPAGRKVLPRYAP